MNFDDLTPELKEKARACKSPEEILALAKEVGYKLTDEDLEAVSGGAESCHWYCSGVYHPPCPPDAS